MRRETIVPPPFLSLDWIQVINKEMRHCNCQKTMHQMWMNWLAQKKTNPGNFMLLFIELHQLDHQTEG